MYWFAGIVMMIYAVLFGVSKGQKKGKAPPGVMGMFYKPAVFLYGKASAGGNSLFHSRQVEKDLKNLYPSAEREQLCEVYYVKKISLVLLVCLSGTLLGVAVTYTAQSSKHLEEGVIARGDYTEEPMELAVAAVLENGEEIQLGVTVNPKALTEEEAEVLYRDFIKKLPDLILGKNTSLRQIRYDLELNQFFEAYPFAVEWRSNRTDILRNSGGVQPVEESVEVVLTANISYEQQEWQEEFTVSVIPPLLSQEEIQERDIGKLLVVSDTDSRTDELWKLPESYRGEELVWKENVQDNGPVIVVGAIAVSMLLFIMSDKDLHDELAAKRESMKQKYPEVVQKLLLYLGAGMTVRASFQKMAAEYEQEYSAENKAHSPKSQAVYQEICYMCRELQAGVSETVAYENFGKRIGVQEYLRLSTLLAQNLKKGNGMLLQRLREEADRASVERLQSSRKLGEEASTKLLLPMVLLLLVVMLMIMIPAFSSMGM